MRIRLFMLVILLVLPFPAFAQDVFHGCGMEGDAKSAAARELNRLKNRFHAPAPADYDHSVTLAALLAPGNDENRWDDSRAAEITGYVHDVKVGGIESTNCHARDQLNRDTHIELVLDPMRAEAAKRVIVEVTPRWRAMMKEKGADWTTKALRQRLLGRWIKVQGWLLFDAEHERESENTNPGRAWNWRGTAWEVHPVTSIEIVHRPATK